MNVPNANGSAEPLLNTIGMEQQAHLSLGVCVWVPNVNGGPEPLLNSDVMEPGMRIQHFFPGSGFAEKKKSRSGSDFNSK